MLQHLRHGCVGFLILTVASVFVPTGASSVAVDEIRLRDAVLDGEVASYEQFGEIVVFRQGDTVRAEKGMPLYPGDIISTGPLDVIITFNDDEVEVIAGKSGQVDILNPSIRAVLGEFVVKIKEATQDFFRVETEFGAAITESTIFIVRAEPSRVDISVFEGNVRVEPELAAAEPVRLAAGEATIMRFQEMPEKRIMDREDTERIITNVRRVERAIQPYTGKRIVKPFAVLSPEEQETLVRQSKRLLISLGYDPGPLNGEVNQQTLSAVSGFKKRQQLPGPARIDQDLVDALEQAKSELDRKTPLEPVDLNAVPGLDTPSGGKVYGDDFLTTDDLVECIRLKQRIEESDSNLEKAKIQLDEKVSSMNRQLDQKLKDLDQTNADAVEKYNEEVGRVNTQRKRYSEDYNKLVVSGNELVDTWNTLYSNRKYFREDMSEARDILRLDYIPDSYCGKSP